MNLSKILGTAFATGVCLAFASPKPDQTHYPASAGWTTAIKGLGIPGGQSSTGYATGKDLSVAYNGHPSFTMKSTDGKAEKWRSFTQGIRADDYRGKRVRLRGYIKTKDVSTGAGLWMRVDCVDRTAEFDNMGDRILKGSADWRPCSVVLDVPADGKAIFYGGLLVGNGQAWMSDLSIDVVDPSKVATTMPWSGPDYSKDPLEPRNMDLSAPSTTGLKLDLPGWSTTTGTWDDSIHRDTKVLFEGKPTASMHPTKSQWDALSLWQEIKAAPYRGKRIQVSAYVKTTDKVSGGPTIAIPGGGQWIVADMPKFVEKGKKWIKDTREWRPVSAVGIVPDWANCIQIGFQLNSVGQVWVGGLSFKVVDSNTPLTYVQPTEKLFTDAQLRTLPTQPVNLDFTR